MARNIYICWVRYQRRPESLRALLDLEVFFIAPLGQHPAIKVPCYLLSGLSMLRILLWTKPDVLWLQLAPSLLLYVAFLYKVLVRPDMLIIADCHNGLLQPRWLELPLVRKLLARCELVFFHNALALERAKQLGISGPHVQLLHTPPAIPGDRVGRRPAVADALGPAFVLMPGSFSGDEPVANVLAAARRLAQWTFVLTGDLTIARRKHDLSNLSPNVIFTGFLPTAEFEWLLVRASVVIALTVNSDVELSAGNEALGFGKPLVVSDSPVSRQLFGDCAVYADPQSVDSLTDAIGAALQRESLQLRIEAHRAARLAASRNEVAAVRGLLTRQRLAKCNVL